MDSRNAVAKRFKTPMRYYCWLRKDDQYSPRYCFIATLGIFCKSQYDYRRRMHRAFGSSHGPTTYR